MISAETQITKPQLYNYTGIPQMMVMICKGDEEINRKRGIKSFQICVNWQNNSNKKIKFYIFCNNLGSFIDICIDFLWAIEKQQ